MTSGKLAVQVAHAAVETALKVDKKMLDAWRRQGMRKITLKVDHLDELFHFKKMAEEAGLTTALITDAAKTFFSEPTTTCLGIGPAPEEKIDSITGKLKMV